MRWLPFLSAPDSSMGWSNKPDYLQYVSHLLYVSMSSVNIYLLPNKQVLWTLGITLDKGMVHDHDLVNFTSVFHLWYIAFTPQWYPTFTMVTGYVCTIHTYILAHYVYMFCVHASTYQATLSLSRVEPMHCTLPAVMAMLMWCELLLMSLKWTSCLGTL